MNLHDDPRLTAYALGELEGAERAEVEALLAADPAAREAVDALRAAAGDLEEALASGPLPVLDAAHRGAIEAALAEPAARTAPILRLRSWMGAAAASALLAIGLALAMTGEGEVQVLDQHFARVPVTPSSVALRGGSGGGGGGGEDDMDGDGLEDVTNGISDGGDRNLFVSNFGTTTVTEVKEPFKDGRRLDEALRMQQPEVGLVVMDPSWVRAERIPPDSRSQGDPSPSEPGGDRAYMTSASLGVALVETGVSGKSVRPLLQGPPTLAEAPLTGWRFNLHAADGDYRGRTENLVRESTTESYGVIVENEFVRPVGEEALSTFSIDVDTASYAIVRRFLQQDGRLPPRGAVRIEEMVNYFPYAYAPPADGRPFAVHVDAAAAPWHPRHRLVRIALKGREVSVDTRPAANLVFLLDVSGSMRPANKLPLVKQSIAMLVEELQARDRVAIVVYAGASGMVLPSTTGDRKDEILAALERLNAGGSTNGGAGIELAYEVAEENFVPGGINRVVLATDGDFNVGVTSRSDLVDLIERKAKTKVFLTALGYGMGNLKDTTLESLADKGNGNYGYVDSLREARKVLVEQGMGTLHAIAKDVKIQVDFNAAKVAAYRLIGYENRLLAAQDFNDDAKDAGEIGAGHTVTALYEVVPAGQPVPGATVEGSKYARSAEEASTETTAGALSPETLTVRLRYKEPEGDASSRFDTPFVDGGASFDAASDDFRFAASVALFGMVLHGSKHCGGATLDAVREIASGALGADEGGYRHEFLTLVDRAAK